MSLSALAFGQTVLARAAEAAGLVWDNESAHSAAYDAEMTAEIFCSIANQWADSVGIPDSAALLPNSTGSAG